MVMTPYFRWGNDQILRFGLAATAARSLLESSSLVPSISGSLAFDVPHVVKTMTSIITKNGRVS
nr:hypothetical protein [uncultured Prevotella sp.]